MFSLFSSEIEGVGLRCPSGIVSVGDVNLYAEQSASVYKRKDVD